MSPKNVGKVLPKFYLAKFENDVAAGISDALRKDFSNVKIAAMAIAQHLEISTDTIKKWYNGSNIPSGTNLIILARASSTVQQVLLQLMNYEK